MARIYSTNTMKPLTITEGDDIRIYKGFQLNARTLTTETFKVLTALSPAVGAGLDEWLNKGMELDVPNTWASFGAMLNQYLTPDHLEELLEKTMGNLLCNDEPIEDLDKHFDKYPQDYLDVIAWAGKENFYDFFMKSGILRSKISKLREKMPQEMINLLK